MLVQIIFIFIGVTLFYYGHEQNKIGAFLLGSYIIMAPNFISHVPQYVSIPIIMLTGFYFISIFKVFATKYLSFYRIYIDACR
jgi:hypothetical protein